jgi:hypothetical protein
MSAYFTFACTSANFENLGTAAEGFVSRFISASQSEKSQTDKSQTDKAPLGWVLTHNKFITLPQLENALTKQQSQAKKLGELLMEQRLISEAQLRDALREQTIRRRGHWVI